MTKHQLITETRIVLRTILSAGVLADAGTAAGVDMQIVEAAA